MPIILLFKELFLYLRKVGKMDELSKKFHFYACLHEKISISGNGDLDIYNLYEQRVGSEIAPSLFSNYITDLENELTDLLIKNQFNIDKSKIDEYIDRGSNWITLFYHEDKMISHRIIQSTENFDDFIKDGGLQKIQPYLHILKVSGERVKEALLNIKHQCFQGKFKTLQWWGKNTENEINWLFDYLCNDVSCIPPNTQYSRFKSIFDGSAHEKPQIPWLKKEIFLSGLFYELRELGLIDQQNIEEEIYETSSLFINKKGNPIKLTRQKRSKYITEIRYDEKAIFLPLKEKFPNKPHL